MTDTPTSIQYRDIHFYPPVALAQENGAIIMQLFNRLKENEKDLTVAKIIGEILSVTKDHDLVFESLAYNEQQHDAKIHQQFPIVWDLKKNTFVKDQEKRAVALSPHAADQNRLRLWLSPSTVIVGHDQQMKPFMIVTGKAVPDTNPKISFYPEQITENFLDIGYQPAVEKFLPGMLYHKSVHHLKKLCPHNH
jgi:hypothetical protein